MRQIVRVAAVGIVALMTGTAFGAAADNPVLRIMPLGDSITHGSQSVRGNGYRAPLYVALTNLGYNVDYVGTQTDNYGKEDPFLADSDHEGHSSWKISNATQGIYENIQSFFAQIDDPHVILLHIGTNDLGDGEPTFRGQATNRLVRLLDRIHECQPSAKVVVTTLMRRYTNAGDTEDNWKYAAITNAFNPAIPGIVAGQQAKGQGAYFLDMHAAVSDWDQIADTVHPNDVGYTNMANAWVSAVTSIVPDPANFATENDLAVVQTTTETVGEDAFAINFTFNQKVTATTACDAANWTVSGTEAVPTITLSADQRTAMLVFPSGEYYTPVTVTAKQGGVRNATGGKALYADATLTIPGVFPQGAYRYVPPEEFNSYRLIYDLDIPAKGNFGRVPVPYTVDDAAKIGAFSRVAYYMELQKAGEPMQYVWVSMDAFTNDAARVGVPVGWQFQKDVTNLRVWSNVPNIRTNETIDVGNIEFWPVSFEGTVTRGLEGALAVYDMDDKPTSGEYGSMQVHDTARTTNSCIFTYNRFQKNDATELGIGPHYNANNKGWDWTQTYNAGQYSLRHLQVYVLPETSATAAPEIVSATPTLGSDGTVVDVKFSVDVLLDGLDAAFSVSSGYVTSVERDGVDFSLVHVYVAAVASDNFNLTVDGARVKAAANGATPMAAGTTLTLARPLPAGVAEHVPAELRAGYVPLYSLNVPVTKGVNWRSRVPYYMDATRSLPDGAERVAYYFEQVKKDGTGTNFVWVSFDAWTDDLAKFGVPVNDSIGFGQKWVTNQDVFSNVDGIVNGTGMDGGFLEFWPHNYGGANDNHIPYAAGTCDWGDSLSGGATTWHACMQVHNVTNRQTIFGISNFNGSNTGQPVGAGIGNNTQYRANRTATGAINPDWTQAYDNADNFSGMSLHVLVRPKPDVPAHVAANVPQAKDYTLLYQIDVPTPFNSHNAAQYAAAHTVDNRARYAGRHVARVGYYLELTTTNATPTTTWCWAAFDGFTDDLASYSFATNGNIKRFVSNLDVASNVSGVKQGRYADGNIEFFFSSYGKGNSLNIGANTGRYDFDDLPSSETAAGYSCLQIHNYNEAQTLISISRLRHSDGNTDIGIGNYSTAANQDWTQTGKAPQYAVRRLYVFVAFETTPSAIFHAVASLDRTKVSVAFDETVPPQLRDPSAWTFTSGNAAVANVVASPVDPREVVLTLAEPLAASTSYTLQCAYTSGGEAKTASTSFTTAAADPLPAFLTAEAVPEAGDYTLVNLLHIPHTTFSYTWTDAPYAVDESRFGNMAFDRVAYLLHLVGTDGLEQWAWASMDAFTDDLSKIGLPTKRRVNDFQEYVTNLSVRAYRSDGTLHVTPGDFPDGNIEFCWHDFSQANSKGIPNANPDGNNVYDWGDSWTFTTKPGYGCLQVHNYQQSQVILSVSRTGASAGPTTLRYASLGIGNRSEQADAEKDWTTAANGASFTTSDLYVFVRPAVASKGNGPVFTEQPVSGIVRKGGALSLHAFAPGATRYQWFRNGRPVPGATSAWIDVPTGVPEDAVYRVVAYADDANYTASEAVTVRVYHNGTQVIVR